MSWGGGLTGKEVFSTDEKESESLNNMGRSPFAPGVTLPSFSLCTCAPTDQQIDGLGYGMDAQQQSSAVLSLEKSANPNGRTEAHERN